MVNKLVYGGIKLFSWGFNTFLGLTLIATALIVAAWCIAWVLLSGLSN